MKMLKLSLIDEPRNYLRRLNDGLVSCVVPNQAFDSIWNSIWNSGISSNWNLIRILVRDFTKESTNENA